jgi:hypothetical protein
MAKIRLTSDAGESGSEHLEPVGPMTNGTLEEAEGWRKASTGLKMLVTAVLLFDLGMLSMFVYSILPSRSHVFEEAFDFDRPQPFFLATGCSGVMLLFLGFAGLLLCTNAPHPPSRSRVKGAMGCVAGIVATLVLYAYLKSTYRYGRGPDFMEWLMPLSYLFLAGAVTLVLLFQQEVAVAFDDPALYSASRWLFGAWLCCVFVNFVLGFYLQSLSPWDRREATGVQIISFLVNLVLALWIPGGLFRTSKVIDYWNASVKSQPS